MKKLIARSYCFASSQCPDTGLFRPGAEPRADHKANIPFEFSVGNRIFRLDAIRWCASSLLA